MLSRFRLVATGCRTAVALLISAALLISPSTSAVRAAPAAQVPLCVAGNWRATNLDETFRALFGNSSSFQVESVSGDVGLSIGLDGSYEIRYSGFNLNGNMGPAVGPFAMGMDGSIRGRFRESQPGALTSSITDSSVTTTTTMMGNTTTDSTPIQMEESDAVSYDCDLGSLSFSVGTERPFTLRFTRTL